MSFVVADTSTTHRPVSAGVYAARCYRLLDLGVQQQEFEGELKLVPKLRVEFELHGEDDDGQPLTRDDGQPMTIGMELTASLGKKAKLRAHLESWRGRPFTPEELKGFDVSKLVGAYGLVNVTHRTSSAGKTYASVSSLSPLPAAMRATKPAPILPNCILDLDDFDSAVFEALPAWLQAQIDESVERRRLLQGPAPTPAPAPTQAPTRNSYADAKAGRAVPGAAQSPATTPAAPPAQAPARAAASSGTAFDDLDDDIPF
ncbi:hypothetical protein [uncultured Sphaerotilus sp.]|uniref:phage replication initiation protein, NGO0469 family n=1 Tax=uncultured Sphaerotilus sp. TaxID=474984 RepID=UPI0030CA1775